MTPIYDQMIPANLAWRGSDFSSVDDFAIDLSAVQRAAINEVFERVRGLAMEDIAYEDCRHDALDQTLANVLDEVQSGRGLVLVRNMPIEGRSVEDIQRINWIVNMHFGPALSQNCLGHRVTLVQEERLANGVQTARGHKSSADLAMHTDNAEILTLLCVRPAPSGGATQFSSIQAVHNELLVKRPDVLPILYRGFPHHRRGDQPEHHAMVTPYDVPVFSQVDGQLSFCLIIGSILAGLAELGRKPTDAELEALDVLHETMMGLCMEFRFKPGDLMVANNLTMVHSRTEYADSPDPLQRRLLLRMWLEARRDRRPVVDEIKAYENVGGRFGCDPVPGRDIARNDYIGVSEEMREIIKAGQARRFG